MKNTSTRRFISVISCLAYIRVTINSDLFFFIQERIAHQTANIPHPMTIATSMYKAICQDKESQCCVIAGETCSGKTEIGKIVLNGLLKKMTCEDTELPHKILMVMFISTFVFWKFCANYFFRYLIRVKTSFANLFLSDIPQRLNVGNRPKQLKRQNLYRNIPKKWEAEFRLCFDTNKLEGYRGKAIIQYI